MIDGPLFSYFGAKWKLAPLYPGPLHRTIVEPFAGSACYALRHAERDVVLVERDPQVAAIWHYLLRVSPAEILALPDVHPGERIDALPIVEEARWLIGFCVSKANAHPVHVPSSWMTKHAENGGFWSNLFRARIARSVERIRHWRVIEGDYTRAPNIRATWFVDPPYQVAGRRYRQSAKAIDFAALGEWCRSRSGQVIACENAGATWLPFRALRTTDSIASRWHEAGRKNVEAVWLGGDGQTEIAFDAVGSPR